MKLVKFVYQELWTMSLSDEKIYSEVLSPLGGHFFNVYNYMYFFKYF